MPGESTGARVPGAGGFDMVRGVVFLVLAGLLVLGAVEFGPAAMERLGMASPAADGGAAPLGGPASQH